MAVINVNGFKFHDGLDSDCIVVEDNRISEYVNYINEKRIIYLSINDLYYKEKDISFLKDCPFVEKININSLFITNLSPLYSLKDLKLLYLDEPLGVLDLTVFEKLEVLSASWNKNLYGLNQCKNLRTLGLWGYKPINNNLEEFTGLGNVENLKLVRANISSLKGCRNFLNLAKLELAYMNKLEVLDELEYNLNTLKNLRFENCKKIKNHEYLTCLKELELLAFGYCGEIRSINFIKKFPKLRSFIFVETTVLDGDLSPCIGLDYVAFNDKKHYSHKFSYFEKVNKKIFS